MTVPNRKRLRCAATSHMHSKSSRQLIKDKSQNPSHLDAEAGPSIQHIEQQYNSNLSTFLHDQARQSENVQAAHRARERARSLFQENEAARATAEPLLVRGKMLWKLSELFKKHNSFMDRHRQFAPVMATTEQQGTTQQQQRPQVVSADMLHYWNSGSAQWLRDQAMNNMQKLKRNAKEMELLVRQINHMPLPPTLVPSATQTPQLHQANVASMTASNSSTTAQLAMHSDPPPPPSRIQVSEVEAQVRDMLRPNAGGLVGAINARAAREFYVRNYHPHGAVDMYGQVRKRAQDGPVLDTYYAHGETIQGERFRQSALRDIDEGLQKHLKQLDRVDRGEHVDELLYMSFSNVDVDDGVLGEQQEVAPEAAPDVEMEDVNIDEYLDFLGEG